jgi:hypothetical protein
LEIWSDYWHEFFQSRPEIFSKTSWFEENSPNTRRLNARQEDRALQKSLQRHREESQLEGRGNTYRRGWQNRRQSDAHHAQGHQQSPSQTPRAPGIHADSKYFQTRDRAKRLLLSAAIKEPDLTAQSKLQAEIDALKRTVNELTLRATLQQK